MASNTEAQKIVDALRPSIEAMIKQSTASCIRSKKMQVTTAYNSSTKLIGVKEAFGNEIFIPCSSTLSSVTVGKSVRVVWYNDDMSTAVALWKGSVV